MPNLDERDRDNIRVIEETEVDFYAPLMYLCLYRVLNTLGLGEATPSRETVRDIVANAYADLQ